ncbi:MAG: hypothetical protein AAF362_12840 [Pseudomonadota bacterium]
MADYYSILKKTISGLPSNTPETRKLVYAKARAAIDRQLRSVQPAPSEAAIASQMASLEGSIDKLEEDFASAASSLPGGGDAAFEAAIASEAQNIRPASGGARLQPGTVQPSAPQVGDAPSQARVDPPLGVSAGQPAYDSSLDALDDVDQLGVSQDRVMTGEGMVERRKSRGFGTVLVALILIALLGAGGYALWLNKDPLMAALGIGQDQSSTVLASDSSDSVAEQPVTDDEGDAKEDARLGGDGQTIIQTNQGESEDTADAGQPASQTDENVRVIDPAEDAPQTDVAVNPVADAADQTAQSETGADTPSETTETAAAGEDASGEAQEAEVAQIPAIGQKAFLYEEGLGNSAASRDNAAIVWSIVQQPPSEGAAPESVIKGELEVPGRGLTAELTIKRNADESLSASHIIELLFDAPPDFSGGSVDTLARFVLKDSEQARGEPLVAVPVKIDNGFFMIALNNLEQARESNKRLLLESNWIDIPLGYTSGRRALLTLEKGAIGDKIYREAFADWDNR